MDERERASSFLNRDPVYYANLLEVLRRGSAEHLTAADGGVVLRDRDSGSWMFALEPGSERLLEHIPDDADLITGHASWCLPLLKRRLGLRGVKIVHSAAWTRPAPPAPRDFGGELRLLDQAWAPWAVEHYSGDFGGLPYMEGVVERGLLGAFVDGQPAGFVGFHDEGSIGLLEVLPAFRRRGIGEALEIGAIRLALSRGQYAFGQVVAGNGPSLALQARMGLSVSKRTLFWLFPPGLDTSSFPC